jgi:hypothetical protein
MIPFDRQAASTAAASFNVASGSIGKPVSTSDSEGDACRGRCPPIGLDKSAFAQVINVHIVASRPWKTNMNAPVSPDMLGDTWTTPLDQIDAADACIFFA